MWYGFIIQMKSWEGCNHRKSGKGKCSFVALGRDEAPTLYYIVIYQN